MDTSKLDELLERLKYINDEEEKEEPICVVYGTKGNLNCDKGIWGQMNNPNVHKYDESLFTKHFLSKMIKDFEKGKYK